MDLIEPERRLPWKPDRTTVGEPDEDLVAAPIAGLVWLESAPAFEAVVFDEKGMPLGMVAPDPRAFVAHELWLSSQPNRNRDKRGRDAEQARVVARLVARDLLHLPYEANALRMLPREVFEAAAPLFAVEPERHDPFP